MPRENNRPDSSGERLRMFVAVLLPRELRRVLNGVQNELPGGGKSLRRVRCDALHLTLLYIGEVSTAQADTLLDGLRRGASAVSPFKLLVAGLGCFGPAARPRVIWAAVPDPPPELLECRLLAERSLHAAGVKPEERPFHPHITLARVRRGRRPPDLRLALDAAATTIYGAVSVHDLALMESRLLPSGPQYNIYGKVSLEGEVCHGRKS